MVGQLTISRLTDIREMGFIESPAYDGLGEVMIDKFKVKDGKVYIDLLTKSDRKINCVIEESETNQWIDSFLGKITTFPTKKESPLKAVTTSNSKTLYNIQTVRTHLFEALERLKSGKISDSQAKATASVAQTILNSAKIEMEYKKLCGNSGEIIDILES